LSDHAATLCPNDRAGMRLVKVESHYGQPVILEQCPDCGGIWFDASELYMAKEGEAPKIDPLDSAGLNTSSVIEHSELECPKDRARLVRFKDPYFPAELIIFRCPLCDGLWLNRGEFARYQEFRHARQEKEVRREDKIFQDNIEKVLADHRAGSNTAAMVSLGRFLSAPLDINTMRPLEVPGRSPEEENAVNSIVDVLLTILSYFTLR
jgi:Zn-finger nucleic acid-binding protein